MAERTPYREELFVLIQAGSCGRFPESVILETIDLNIPLRLDSAVSPELAHPTR